MGERGKGGRCQLIASVRNLSFWREAKDESFIVTSIKYPPSLSSIDMISCNLSVSQGCQQCSEGKQR